MIGGFTLASAVLTGLILGYFNSKKERDQAARQERADDRKHEREVKKEHKAQVVEIYRRCIGSVLPFVIDDKKPIEGNEKVDQRLRQIALKWLGQLLVRIGEFDKAAGNFSNDVASFAADPHRSSSWLIGRIQDLQERDPIFGKHKDPEDDQDGRHFVDISLSREYRRQLFLDGREVSGGQKLELDLKKLTKSQRALLWEHYENHSQLPKIIQLWVPALNQSTGEIIRTGVRWKASLDPEICTAANFIDSWEKDFAIALRDAEAARAEHPKVKAREAKRNE
jgi:hypothetical protein